MTLVITLGIASLTLIAKERPASSSEAVDLLFAEVNSSQSPGCAVGVIHKGEYVHRAGYGMANLEHNIPITTQSIFRIGSVSKQFTAMAIALLEEQGRLDFDKDIHDYLPALRAYDHKVSIRQMLHHVSGMSDYEGGPEIFPTATGTEFRFGNEDYLSIAEFYQGTTKMPLRSAPETEWHYSNTAYFLLSQVVKRVSGKTLREFAAKEIFGPLEMDNSFFNDNVNGIVSERADGYQKKSNGWEIYMTNLSWVGDGGVYTNIDDFLHWDQNFYQNKLGKGEQSLIDTLMSNHPAATTDDGSRYAFGLDVDEYKGQTRIRHGGSWVGFRAAYARFPDLEFSSVALCNFAKADPTKYLEKITDIYWPDLVGGDR